MPMKICPFTLGLFAGTAILVTLHKRTVKENERQKKQKEAKDAASDSKPSTPATTVQDSQVVFVLGGPGSGKGTQCQLITQRLPGWVHLSAGDLLRAERSTPDSQFGEVINQKIANGELVPSSITVKLIRKAMQQHCDNGVRSFLIDGFPRSAENIQAWQDVLPPGIVKFVLFFQCPEEVLVGRLLERGQTSGRNDDNIDVIRKRFQTFQKESLPVIDDLKANLIPVHVIASDKPIEQVYQDVVKFF